MPKKKAQDIAKSIEERSLINEDIFEKTISTGSTLLDLAISGQRCNQGGIPRGKLIEIFGPSSSGKSALLAEICSAAQSNGGQILVFDPEARIDQKYFKIYDVKLTDDNYYIPDTVNEVVDLIYNWNPVNNDVINVIGVDSIAALCSNAELESKDKYGAQRAKDFSTGLRKICKRLTKKGWIIIFTNQVRDSLDVVFGSKEITPGGKAVPFYADCRIRIGPGYPKSKIGRKVKYNDTEISIIDGIISNCKIVKSTIDNPYREANINIIFNYGIDDIRANLQYLKNVKSEKTYMVKEKSFKSIREASDYVESNNLEKEIKNEVIKIWNEILNTCNETRKPKIR